jgi:hypothetical protein
MNGNSRRLLTTFGVVVGLIAAIALLGFMHHVILEGLVDRNCHGYVVDGVHRITEREWPMYCDPRIGLWTQAIDLTFYATATFVLSVTALVIHNKYVVRGSSRDWYYISVALAALSILTAFLWFYNLFLGKIW